MPYEIPLVFALVVPVMLSGSMSMVDIINAQSHMWFIFMSPLAAVMFFVSSQAETGQDIELSKVKKGDLVFFSHSGDRIQHVGIITSDEGNPLTMIHASTSKGVIHSDLENSAYWKPRIKWAKRVITDAVA